MEREGRYLCPFVEVKDANGKRCLSSGTRYLSEATEKRGVFYALISAKRL